MGEQNNLAEDLVFVGSHIRAARQARGWKLHDLSSATGISIQQVSQIEKGQALGVTFKRLKALCDVLEMDWLTLLDARAARAKEGERPNQPPSGTGGILLGSRELETLRERFDLHTYVFCPASAEVLQGLGVSVRSLMASTPCLQALDDVIRPTAHCPGL